MSWLAVGALGGTTTLALAATPALSRLRVLRAVPGVGLVAWLGTSAAVVGASLFAGPLTLLPGHGPEGVRAWASCLLHCQHPMPHHHLAVALPVLVSLTVAVRLVVVTASLARRRSEAVRRHRAATDLLGRLDERSGALVVDHPTPVGYCLPGRPRRIVLSSAAVATLDEPQLAAVVAHERAHLDGRHHLLVAVAAVLAGALPGLPLLRTTRDQVELLVERAADESAGRRHGRRVLAGALLRMAAGLVPDASPGTAPDTALSATGANLATRMDYLLTPPPRPVAMASGVAALVAGPVAAALVAGAGLVVTMALVCQVLSLL
ncbi:M56 family metallopeptidase [Streptoalloteichus hindustanus]|uniref:Peptidase family M48 n=1 Tax=Streptoalloteichus hindustanus TaxID=2017 RepID=A0A1M5AEI8_STRHI|nr:M56 family metallopeptidase [Streptoalloteichus hindustanus]SHF28565.1 Peptidase family M48 [Streptoalloteichus hindustanus]